MSFEINGIAQDCAHGCTSLVEHSRRTSAEHYVNQFENHFNEYVGGIASVIFLNGTTTAAKPMIQALVNSYHELGRSISPLTVPTSSHFNTLQMFVLITGASLEHSGEDESLKIIEQAGGGKES